MQQIEKINPISIAFCVNDGYVIQLGVTIFSILKSNPDSSFLFYVFSSDFSEDSKIKMNKIMRHFPNSDICYKCVEREKFSSLKLNIDYISLETYYRYVLADMLPDVDKILYLDADLIVKGDLRFLWDTDISGVFMAGAEDKFITTERYKSKIGFLETDLYVNAGVLLMNLSKMRQEKMSEILLRKTQELTGKISYQDQDILNVVFKGKIKEIDILYNFTTYSVKHEKSKRKSATIIHYTGAAKPWKKNSRHRMKKIYLRYMKEAMQLMSKKIKVGLLIDEFFGGAGTAFGGYGFLARKYIAKYIQGEDIQVDVLLGKSKNYFVPQKFHEDNVNLYRLPRRKWFAQTWLKKQNYDVYLSIELTSNYVLKNELDLHKKLILWIQDPRPKSDWDEIKTVKLFPEVNYYNQAIYDFVHQLAEQNRVRFVSQGYFLNEKAKELYRLGIDTPIQYLPNPIDVDLEFDVSTFKKKDSIIFLGRIESVKRGWLFCEIAKKMPEYQFYVLGQTFREKEQNSKIMALYQNISNLHFVGHVDGIEKERYLKESKILINTSIHEALPISFLEALSYGTVLVSNQNPENLTEKFGLYVGEVLGDGFDKVDLYVEAVKRLMTDNKLRQNKAEQGRAYVEQVHAVTRFIHDLKKEIYQEAK